MKDWQKKRRSERIWKRELKRDRERGMTDITNGKKKIIENRYEGVSHKWDEDEEVEKLVCKCERLKEKILSEREKGKTNEMMQI